MPFTVLVHQDPSDPTYYWATVRELPGLVTQGNTLEELKENVADAIELYLSPDEPFHDRSGPVVAELEAEIVIQ